MKVVYKECDLSDVYSIRAMSDCALFSFPEVEALKKKWSEAMKSNMVKEGSLC